MIKRFDVCVWKTYDKDGDLKKQYTKIGTLIEFPANGDKPRGFKIELPIFGHEKFAVFEQKPKNEPSNTKIGKDEPNVIQTKETSPDATQPANTATKEPADFPEYPEEEVNPEDIPF